MDTVLSIADILVQLHAAHPHPSPALPEAYRDFLVPRHRPAAAHYDILPADTPRLPSLNPDDCIWQSEVWRMGSLPQHRLGIEIHDAIHDRWVPVADLAEDFRSGTIQPFAGRRAAPSTFALNYPYDQAILTNLLNECGVIVLHAAAVILDGHGLALGGRSGIGKTTLARLCREAGGTLLNDDRCALFQRGGQWWISPTPWHGEEPEIHHTECRLSHILHLERSIEPGSQRLDPADALARLLATGIAPFYRRAGLEKAMSHMADIVEAVPSHLFRCHPDARAITQLRRFLPAP